MVRRIKKLIKRILGTRLPISKKQRAIRRALVCKGWTNEPKLSRMFDLVQATEHLNGDILEIGSAWGRSTVLLGLASEKSIWSIDPHTGGLAYIRKGENQDSFKEFLRNIEKYGISKKVRILKNTTREVLDQALIPDATEFSLVFIDGLHTPEAVQIDFELSYPRLVKSGVMVFDDYFEPSVRDYAEMIDRLVQANAISLIKDAQSRLVWFFKP